tara:strand:+ start:114 stop:305 length:192 start_codon:yes stop_codon:yes gene_type:complete
MTNTAYTGTERKNYPKKVVKKYIKRLVFFLTLQMVSEKNREKAMFYSTASTNYATIYLAVCKK